METYIMIKDYKLFATKRKHSECILWTEDCFVYRYKVWNKILLN